MFLSPSWTSNIGTSLPHPVLTLRLTENNFGSIILYRQLHHNINVVDVNACGIVRSRTELLALALPGTGLSEQHPEDAICDTGFSCPILRRNLCPAAKFNFNVIQLFKILESGFLILISFAILHFLPNLYIIRGENLFLIFLNF